MRGRGSCFVGIDLGSGACKVALVTEDGHAVGGATREYPTYRPVDGAAEQDPSDWWKAFVEAYAAACAAAEIRVDQVRAVCVDGVTHNAVLLDADWQVLRPVITFFDTRCASQVDRLRDRAGGRILALTANQVTTAWTLPHLAWLRDHEAARFAAIRHVLFPKDYLRWRLTGEYATDRVDAMGTQLYDVAAARWSAELCQLVDLPPGVLPPIHEPHEVLGRVTGIGAAASGLPAGTPVVVGSTDTAIEMFGAGCLSPGALAVKLATIGRVTAVSPEPHADGTLITYQHLVPGLWYPAAGTKNCASSVRWLRDTLFAGRDFSELDRQAAETPLGAEGLLFHPYLAGELAPYWDPFLRGDFVGLTFRHGPGHLARAVLEGVAFSIREAYELLAARGIARGEARLIGGGSRSGLWRQILSDVLDLRMSRPSEPDAAFGAAMLAAVGVKHFASHDEAVRTCVRLTDTVEPDADRQARYASLYPIYRHAQRQLSAVSHELTAWARATKGSTP